jgi:hypothetical protein
MDSKETQNSLVGVGFTNLQMERLSKFRHKYVEEARQQNAAELRRLEFTRWLVATGRLTDYS